MDLAQEHIMNRGDVQVMLNPGSVSLIPYGAASVGMALGIMASQQRFPRPSLVFLDGDQEMATGCIVLPGDDAPERVVFESLKSHGWPDIASRIGRGAAETIDALNAAMALANHHDWVKSCVMRRSSYAGRRYLMASNGVIMGQ
jgi:hypothetical protein